MSSSNKKRHSWTRSDLEQAITAIQTGSLSSYKAAEKFNIPRRTLRDYLKSGKSKQKLGRKSVFSKEREQDFVSRIMRFADLGIPLTEKMIRKQAFVFCEKYDIPNNFNKKLRLAGRDWLKLFLKRNRNLAKRKAQFMNQARGQKLNKAIVSHHFKQVEKLYDELGIHFNPERLYNMDEKGCRLTMHRQPTVIAQKGAKRVHMQASEHAENVTIVGCANAVGNAIPPMIIFKGVRRKPEFETNLPPGAIVRMAPKGSMTTELFIDFLKHFAKYKTAGNSLLVFDGAKCHLDFRIAEEAELLGITLYCLPSNTTHELQPLDKACYKPFESYWDVEVMQHFYENHAQKLTRCEFNKILSKIWSKCMSHANITSGFRATGLYPFNPHILPENAFAPSVLTERQAPQNEDTNEPSVSSHSDVDNVGDSEESQNLLNNVHPSAPEVMNEDTSEPRVSSPMQLDSEESQSLLNNIHSSLPEVMNDDTGELRVLSPIILNDNKSQCFANVRSLASPRSLIVCNSTYKLVGYSSSSDDDANGASNVLKTTSVAPEVTPPHSLVEGSSTSGLQPAKRPGHLSSDDNNGGVDTSNVLKTTSVAPEVTPPRSLLGHPRSSTDEDNSEDEDISKLMTRFMERPLQPSLRIYSSGSETKTDSDNDDVPLANLSGKSQFHMFMPTPNYAITKKRPRRKALNYKGQRITKDLFNDTKETKKNNKIKKKTENLTKKNETKKTLKKGDGKTKTEEVTNKDITKKTKKFGERRNIDKDNETKTIIKNKTKISKKKGKENNSDVESWYCNACSEDRIADMRPCASCRKWYHEECVGLTKNDAEIFKCPGGCDKE